VSVVVNISYRCTDEVSLRHNYLSCLKIVSLNDFPFSSVAGGGKPLSSKTLAYLRTKFKTLLDCITVDPSESTPLISLKVLFKSNVVV
jgi:hypothetical protein